MNNKIYVFANVFKRHIGNVKMTLCNRLLSNTSFEQVLVTLNLIRKAKATTGTWKAELQGLFLLKPFWAQIAVIGKGFMSKIFLRGWENMLEFEKVMTKKAHYERLGEWDQNFPIHGYWTFWKRLPVQKDAYTHLALFLITSCCGHLNCKGKYLHISRKVKSFCKPSHTAISLVTCLWPSLLNNFASFTSAKICRKHELSIFHSLRLIQHSLTIFLKDCS